MTSAGYRELLRDNRAVRWLWIGSAVSLFGDWFNTMAIFGLVERLTGSPLALGVVFAIKLMGYAVFGLPGGLLADRVNRKALMITADLARAVIVLGFILVEDAGDMPLLFVLMTLQVGFGASFDPAFRASLPNITTPRELLTANALLAATWSALLAIGAAVGGLATARLGTDAVFAIDAVTYLFSAYAVSRVAIPFVRPPPASANIAVAAARELRAGWRYLVARPAVARIALAKASWAIGGAGLVYFLTQLGPLLTPGDAALGIGLLFSVRGVGTGLGPLIARRWFTDPGRWPVLLGACVAASGLAYLAVGVVAWSFLIAVPIAFAHAASGANWVVSTQILQERVADGFRGRVFGAEMVALMSVEAAFTLLAAALLEAEVLDLRAGVLIFAAAQLLCGAAWMFWPPRRDSMDESLS
ncbi:MAG: MFS transporter [Deltaproteobacteria bacterium HGW-Deltaproteobacteria-14]|jgi:MFS family permease|nr:MAG: MFS transporter [Deltaproteobacteria bacterium HGW-Deltaproteobacteria-14]